MQYVAINLVRTLLFLLSIKHVQAELKHQAMQAILNFKILQFHQNCMVQLLVRNSCKFTNFTTLAKFYPLTVVTKFMNKYNATV